MFTRPSAWHTCLVPLLAFALFCPTSRADEHTGPAKGEAPYFFVNSDDPATDRLPLKDTRVDVRIAGVMADVTVIQHYRNEGTRPIEARYVFPGSTQAAIYGMNVRLGERLLTAKIREKQQARVEYETAKTEGKTAALLEQHRSNVFEMNVANILPDDDVRVELHYTELMVPRDGKYQFVFPTVVGPRYTGSPEKTGASETWTGAPYLHAGEPSATGFAMKVALSSPIAIKDVASSSHQLDIRRTDGRHVDITLANAGRSHNNRDFILDYRLNGDAIESGLMLFKGKEENLFLAMIAPPKVVTTKKITPRDYVFVVDVSGSMNGFPLDVSKTLLKNLIGSLRPSDSFNVILFAGASQQLAPQSLPATSANIARALQVIDEQQGGGGTELLPALRRAMTLQLDRDRSRSVVVITDGYVSVEKEAFALIRRNLNQANVFAFGIGSSVNRDIIEGMARAGQGEPFIVTEPQEAAAEAERLRRMVEAPVLTHVRASFRGLDVYDVGPPAIADVLAQRPVLVFGKWRGEAKGQLLLSGYNAEGVYQKALDFSPAAASPDNAALRYLWARQRISTLSDEKAVSGDDGLADEITTLGLRYSLLTDYTSFIAVDHVVRNTTGDSASVDQPLPMPQGVSDLAIGAEVPATPEPEAWGMLLLAGGLLLFWSRRLYKVSAR